MPAERSGAPSTSRRAKTKSSPTIAMSASTRRSKPIFSKRCRRPSSRASPHHVDGLPRRRLPIIALARRQLDALAVLASLQQAVLELRHRGEPVDQEEGDDRQQQRHRQAGEAGGKAVVFLLAVAAFISRSLRDRRHLPWIEFEPDLLADGENIDRRSRYLEAEPALRRRHQVIPG